MNNQEIKNKINNKIDSIKKLLIPTVTRKNSTDINEDLNVKIYHLNKASDDLGIILQ